MLTIAQVLSPDRSGEPPQPQAAVKHMLRAQFSCRHVDPGMAGGKCVGQVGQEKAQHVQCVCVSKVCSRYKKLCSEVRG